MGRIPVCMAVLVAIVASALASAAGAAPTGRSTLRTPHGVVHVSLAITRFYATRSGARAQGTATATLAPEGADGASPVTVKKNVTLEAESSEGCKVLSLKLEKLELKILGLEVNLEGNKAGEPVELTVTGESNGGALGSLFCQLAKTKLNLGQTAAVQKMNRAIARNGGALHPIALTAHVRGQAIADAKEGGAVPTGPTGPRTGEVCPVLSLVLGPLHLDVLGLVVDLDQIHLTLNANSSAGVLGRLFCGVVNA